MPQWSCVAPGASGDAQDKATEIGARISDRDLSAAFWAPLRSGAGATVRRRCSRTSCSTAASRERWWSTATAAASSTKPSPITSSRWRCWQRAIGDPGIPHRGSAACGRWPRHGAARRLGQPGRFGRRILIAGDSIEQLAQRLKIDPGNLRETVDRMNEYAQTGRDLEFGRGSTVYQNHNGDASAGGANPNLGPIATPPFYALRLYPSDIGTSAGLVTDDAARVLDPAIGRSRASTPAEMTCSRSWAEPTPGRGSRSDRRSRLPISLRRTQLAAWASDEAVVFACALVLAPPELFDVAP